MRTITVAAYTRKDGTQVKSYTRVIQDQDLQDEIDNIKDDITPPGSNDDSAGKDIRQLLKNGDLSKVVDYLNRPVNNLISLSASRIDQLKGKGIIKTNSGWKQAQIGDIYQGQKWQGLWRKVK